MPREMWGQRQTRERCRKIGNKEKCVQCLANELSLYLFSSLFSFMVKGREETGLLSSHRSGPHSQGQQPTNPPPPLAIAANWHKASFHPTARQTWSELWHCLQSNAHKKYDTSNGRDEQPSSLEGMMGKCYSSLCLWLYLTKTPNIWNWSKCFLFCSWNLFFILPIRGIYINTWMEAPTDCAVRYRSTAEKYGTD